MSKGNHPKKQHQADALAQLVGAPEQCRARESGCGDYVDCLVDDPSQCAYATKFGRGFLCRHPQKHLIAERTARGSIQ